MKKGIAALILGMVFGSTLYAENYSEGKKFLGLEVGAAQIQGGVYLDILDPSSYDQFYEGSDVTYGLRFGAENDKYRTMLLYDYYDNTDEDQNLQLGLISIDYYVVSEDMASMTIKPFVGINVGYMRYESTLVDDSDFVYGGQAGVVASISDSIDIDLSYRYSLTWETEVMDHFGAVMLGLNYLY